MDVLAKKDRLREVLREIGTLANHLDWELASGTCDGVSDESLVALTSYVAGVPDTLRMVKAKLKERDAEAQGMIDTMDEVQAWRKES